MFTDEASLSSLQRLKLRLSGHARVGFAQKAGWKEQVPLFAFNCETHGIVCNTPQGHMHRLICPRCFPEEIASTLDAHARDQMQLDALSDASLVEGY